MPKWHPESILNPVHRGYQKDCFERAVFWPGPRCRGPILVFLAPDLGILILITALLENGSTKNALGLRFAEADFLMNTPYKHATMKSSCLIDPIPSPRYSEFNSSILWKLLLQKCRASVAFLICFVALTFL